MQSNNSINTQAFGLRQRNFKPIFHFISAVLIPISFGVFTIIISLQQESIAKINRDVDLRIAAEQDRQNLELAIDGQRNAQLVAYMREVSDLLLANNFSLMKPILTGIVLPKTLAALRQLDVTRKGYLLRFLYESRIIYISNPPSLNLAGADLNQIQIGSYGYGTDMRYAFLKGVNLENSSFTSVSFGFSDFGDARMRGASFNVVSFDYVNFRSALLQETDFTISNVYKADLTNANIFGSKITLKQINSAGSISSAILPDGSQGRNPNVFIDPNCQQLIYQKRIEQNVNMSQYREWMAKIGRNDWLSYMFTGWFDKIDDLRADFAELDQHGKVLRQYCRGKKDSASPLNTTQSCHGDPWKFSSVSLSNDTNQYKNVIERIYSHNETYTIYVNITLGQNGSCRDVYFSIETA